MKQKESHDLARITPTQLRLENAAGIDVSVFANPSVPIDTSAVAELKSLLELDFTIKAFQQADPEAFTGSPSIEKIALTPDFHKARGIPVGTILETSEFVVPQAIGNDINCGMRLHTTSLAAEQIRCSLDSLETNCRRVFFEGARRIPTKYEHREAMLLQGIRGLYETVRSEFDEGLWSYFHRTKSEEVLARIDRAGSLPASQILNLSDFVGKAGQLHRDSQIGSIGGGNHFVEFQEVKRIIDGTIAHAWGIKEGMVTVMVHTGSLGIGHVTGSYYQEKVREVFPKSVPQPENKIFPLPLTQKFEAVGNSFWNALHNGANFAYVNRMFLALMAWACLEKSCGTSRFDLLYDAPHNMVWPSNRNGRPTVLHRKGACPARGYAEMEGTPFAYYGEPVLVPGSMGASSFILAGCGFEGTIQSAAHGAGRAYSRGSSMKGFEADFDNFLKEFRVVTPLDLKRQDVRNRPDIVEKKLAELKQEAPFAYKGIGPVIETITDTGMARPVAELVPLMTVKG